MAIPQPPVWPSGVQYYSPSSVQGYVNKAKAIFPNSSDSEALAQAYPNVANAVNALGGVSSYTKQAQAYDDAYNTYTAALDKYTSDNAPASTPTKTKEQRAAEKAKAKQDAAIIKAANVQKNAAFDAALAQRNTALDAAQETLNKARADIDALRDSGQITSEERTTLRDQALADYRTTQADITSTYDALKDAARTAYDDVFLDVKGRLPDRTQSLFDTAAYDEAMDAYTAAIRAGDTSQKMPSLMDYMTVSTEELFKLPEIDRSPLYTPGFDPNAPKMSQEQANDLADQLILYGGINNITDASGENVENPKEYLANAIATNGYNNVYQQLVDKGFDLNIQAPESLLDKYVDPEIAKDFVTEIFNAQGYDPATDPYFQNWVNSAINRGFEGFVDNWNSQEWVQNQGRQIGIKGAEGAEGKGGDSGEEGFAGAAVSAPRTINIAPYQKRNDVAKEGVIDQYVINAKNQFTNNINDILAGADLSITGYEDLSGVQSFDDLLKATEDVINWGDTSQEVKDAYSDYFDKYGADITYGMMNLSSGLYNQAYNRGIDVTTGEIKPYETDIYGDATSSRPGAFESDIYGTTDTFGGATPTTTTPTAPTTGTPTQAFMPGQIRGYTPDTGTTAPTGTTTYQPAPYTPPPAFLAEAPARPTLTPAQQVIGTPGIDRGVPVPMSALTPQEAGSTFQQPTQEDYFAFFGYTPEQLNAAQYLAELEEGVPRAGVAAQTVPVIPTAVPSAPTGMKEGGMPQDAQRLANQGRGGDTMLVHMAPSEVAGLQSLAQQMGTSLTINPQTGLPEAIKLKDFLGPAVVLGAYALGVPISTAALAYGAGTAIGSGSLEQGIAAGLTAYGGANLAAGGLEMAGVGIGPSASGAATGAAEMGSISLTPSPGDLDYFSSASRNILSDATNYAMNIPSTVPTTAGGLVDKGALPFLIGSSSEDAIVQARDLKEQEKANNAIYAANLEAERKRNRQLFESTLGAIPVRSGGLMRLAQGGMTYAEGGGTTGPTNEPRLVKGTGDGMSDSVPATIEGVQEARLANDEFVVPADVVADLGNGSSSAGAQQLYDMMDRVRQARHGTTEQPPEIDVRKIMPA